MMFRVLSCVACLVLAAGVARAAEQVQYAPPPAWVTPIPIPKPPSGAGAAVQLLLQDVQVRYGVDEDDSYGETAFRVQTPEALTGAGNISLVWRPDIETLVIHRMHIIRDGRVIDVLAGGKTFTILRRETNLELATLDGTLTATIQPEGLQVGDIVDLAFTRQHRDPVYQGRSEGAAVVARPGVVSRVYIRQLWPTSKPMRQLASADLGQGVLARHGDQEELTFDFNNVEAPKAPAGAPIRFAHVGELQMTQFADWAEISTLMWPLYQKAARLAPDSPLRAEIARIKAASPDPRTRTELALRLVQDKVRYLALAMNLGGYIPADADQTWTRRFGDCKGKTALLLAILDALGVEAQPALIDTLTGDGLDAQLPILGEFDHVIVRARIGGKVYWLDATRSGDRHLDDIDIPAFHWALPVQPSGAKLEKLERPPLDRPELEALVRLDASAGLDAPAAAHVEFIYRGDTAVGLHELMQALSTSDWERAQRESWNKQYPWITISSVGSAYDDDRRVLTETMDGSGKMEWATNSGFRQYEIGESNLGYKADFRREPGPNRDAPYAVAYPTYNRWNVTVALPNHGLGFSVGNAPDVDKTIAGVAYRRVSRLQAGVATMEATERSLAPEFPATEADADAVALRQLSDYDVTISTKGAVIAPAAPDNAFTFSQQGVNALLEEDYDSAITDLTQAIKLDPQNSSDYYNRALAYLETNRRSLAIADFDAALRLRPSDSLALLGRGQARLMDGDERRAEEDFDAAVKVAPDNYQVLFRRADAYRKAGRFERAIESFTALIAKFPDARRESSLTGRCRARLGLGRRLDQAIADCDAALGLKAADRGALTARAQALFKLGRLDDAIAGFSTVLANSPNDKSALCGRGAARQARGLRTEAAEDLARAGPVCKPAAGGG